MKKIFLILLLICGSFITYSQMNFGTNFAILTNLPIDTRMVKATLTDRDALNSMYRYEGLVIYVTAEHKNYQLVGGTSNSYWVEVATYSAGTGLSLSGNVFSHSPHTGDVTGTSTLTVVALRGRNISPTTPNSGQVYKWNGSAWTPSNDDNNVYYAGKGVTLYNDTFSTNGNGIITVANMTLRDFYPSSDRVEGMMIYVKSVRTTYQLNGGTGNYNWQPFTTGTSAMAQHTPFGGYAVRMYNGTRNTIMENTVVTVDTGTNRSIMVMTNKRHDCPIGVTYERIVSGNSGWVVISGFANVRIIGDVRRGNCALNNVYSPGSVMDISSNNHHGNNNHHNWSILGHFMETLTWYPNATALVLINIEHGH